MSRIVVVLEPTSQTFQESWYEDNDGNQDNFAYDWPLNPMRLAAYRMSYDAGASLTYSVAGTEYAETPAAVMGHLREPAPWMMRFNPLDPRATTWQILEILGWINLPAVGQLYTLYIVREGEQVFTLIWNASRQDYESPTADQPEHQDAVFEPVVSNYTVYGTDGTPSAAQRINFSAGAADIPTSALALNSEGDKVVAVQHVNATVSIELRGSAANGANAAFWSGGTGQPTNYLGRIRLLLKTTVSTGTVTTILHSQTFSGSVVPNEATDWSILRLKQKAIMPAGSELYAEIEALGDSTETDLRSSVLAVVSGHLTVERYQAEAAIDYAAQIPWSGVALDDQELQHAYVSFPLATPVRVEDLPRLTATLRFVRSGGDFDLQDTWNMRGHHIFPDQAAAEAGQALLNPRQWLTLLFLNDARAHCTFYRGTPWPGWDQDANFYNRIRLWFWGDGGYIRGVRVYCYQTQISITRVWLTLEFGR